MTADPSCSRLSPPGTTNHVNSYYAASARDTAGFAQLHGDHTADVVIIGGGFSGISTAIDLCERGFKVIVLESQKVGWGASGRNGGQVTGSLSGDVAMQRQFAKQLGHKKAEEYVWNLRWRGHDIIKKRIEKYQIACDLRFGHVQTALLPKHLSELSAMEREAERHGISDELEMCDAAAIQKVIGSTIYLGGLINRRNMHLHSLDLCVGEARALQQLGGQVFEKSLVKRIEKSRTYSKAITAHGSVTANHVVIAGNAFHLLEQKKLGGSLFPANLANMATAPLSPELAQELNPQNLAVYDCRFVLDYYRLTADNRLMFGSGTNYSGRESRNIEAELRPAMERVFPQLKGVKIDFAWNCKDGIIANRIPQAGRIHPNIWYVQGYSGHGIALTHIMGEVLANAISGNAEEFELYSRIRHLRLPFARSFGSQLQALGMMFYHAKDRFTG